MHFGNMEIDNEMMRLAEKFLVRCICKEKDVQTFDHLRRQVYYKKFKELDLEKLPPTSSSIREHIKRAYLQSHVWINSAFVASVTINPLNYGYEQDETGESIKAKIVEESLPEELPMPCKCNKCAKSNICICRVNKIACCQYCNCKPDCCKNPSS